MDMDKLKKGFNDTAESAKDQINKVYEKPGETANNALNKGKEQAASAADSAKATLDKALGKGENNNA
ncbi:hypothetical protein BDV27DRAFT_162051 [Aspergillus caelatus]|uniref:Uncharacterized protein n=2 Tax=Aspergillus subgen. Circumdati TaxID=2720871 RepID=A0A5N6ZRK4_9EURO|nr:uncharacterized protein BDV27DRAFT_162051 [Aspergillus caelatus]KAE8360028.1 hypothetical protein BDV27DRAFT_162051 [Aspergillus caelatus]KAE8410807.1 hypothetical protein BDV36DRAFT_302418 [Aspergillus pseudocaelatus]